jgi:SNARE protein
LHPCRLLKDFEREARTDGMPAPILAERKKALADELNELIKRKKEIGAFAERSELLEGATGPPQEDNLESRWPKGSMSTSLDNDLLLL